jgi:hypothetical protein
MIVVHNPLLYTSCLSIIKAEMEHGLKEARFVCFKQERSDSIESKLIKQIIRRRGTSYMQSQVKR